MKTLLITKTQKGNFSLKQQESGKKVNKGNDACVTPHMMITTRHKVGYVEQTDSSTKRASQSSPLLLPNNKRPHIRQEELNRLAKVWCELMIGQRLEARHNQAPECL